jgi:hypothetical protein
MIQAKRILVKQVSHMKTIPVLSGRVGAGKKAGGCFDYRVEK